MLISMRLMHVDRCHSTNLVGLGEKYEEEELIIHKDH
jgi:hypothetical protein